jgi:hypothetical protein
VLAKIDYEGIIEDFISKNPKNDIVQINIMKQGVF